MERDKSNLTRRAALKSAAAVAACVFATEATSNAAPAPATAQNAPADRQHLWFKSGEAFCSAMVHRAPGVSGNLPGVLIMHGLVASKDQPHRIFVALADALAKAGFVAFRFDLRGRGESDGHSIDATPKRDLEDARAALATLSKLPGVDAKKTIVMGMSWGGTLACYLAGENLAVTRVILWSSCPRDNETWSPIMVTENNRQICDQFGNVLSKAFYDEVPELTPQSQLKRLRQPVLLVYGTRDEVTRPAEFDKLKDELTFADVSCTSVVIDGADHALMNHLWEQKAIDETVRWLLHE